VTQKSQQTEYDELRHWFVNWYGDDLKAYWRIDPELVKANTTRSRTKRKPELVEPSSQPYPSLQEWDDQWDMAGPARRHLILGKMKKERQALLKRKSIDLTREQRIFWASHSEDDLGLDARTLNGIRGDLAPKQTERVQRAQDYRQQGKSYQWIAERFGVSKKTAQKWVKDPPQGKRERKLPV
jgi:hypothetical protein